MAGGPSSGWAAGPAAGPRATHVCKPLSMVGRSGGPPRAGCGRRAEIRRGRWPSGWAARHICLWLRSVAVLILNVNSSRRMTKRTHGDTVCRRGRVSARIGAGDFKCLARPEESGWGGKSDITHQAPWSQSPGGGGGGGLPTAPELEPLAARHATIGQTVAAGATPSIEHLGRSRRVGIRRRAGGPADSIETEDIGCPARPRWGRLGRHQALSTFAAVAGGRAAAAGCRWHRNWRRSLPGTPPMGQAGAAGATSSDENLGRSRRAGVGGGGLPTASELKSSAVRYAPHGAGWGGRNDIKR